MKTFLSLVSFFLALWLVWTFVLPQTDFSARVHQEIETQLSQQLEREVKIMGGIQFVLLPQPSITAEQLIVREQQEIWLSVERASLQLKFSLANVPFSFFALTLDRPRLFLRGYGRRQILRESQPLVAWLAISFITIKDGTFIYTDTAKNEQVSFSSVKGFISSDSRRGPLELELSFTYGGQEYQSQFSMAKLDSNKPVALNLLLRHKKEKLTLTGFLGKHDQLYGDLLIVSDRFQIPFKVETQIKLQNNIMHFTALRLSADDIVLKAQGKIDFTSVSPMLALRFSEGRVIWQGVAFDQIKAGLLWEAGQLKVNGFSTATPDGGQIKGRGIWKNNTLSADLTLKARRLDWMFAAAGFAISKNQRAAFTDADLVLTLSATDKKLTAFYADGKIAATTLKLKADLSDQVWDIRSRWQNHDGRQLARQLGWHEALAVAGAAKAIWRVKGTLDGNNKFGAALYFDDLSYRLVGTLKQKAARWQSFIGRVQARGRATQHWVEHLGLASMIKLAPHFQFSAQLRAAPDRFHFSRLKLRSGQGRRIDKVKGDLSLQQMASYWQMDSNLTATRLPLILFSGDRRRFWPEAFPLLRGSIRLAADRVEIAGEIIKNVRLEMALSDSWRVKNFEGQWGGGLVSAAADLSLKAGTPVFHLALALTDIDLKLFTQNFIGHDFIHGRITLNTRLSTTGTTSAELLKTLSGQGQITMQKGRLIGFDASLLNRSLPQLENFSFLEIVINYAFSQGATDFENFQANFNIQQGKLTTSPIKLRNPDLSSRLLLQAHLSDKKMRAVFDFKMPLKPDYPAMQWIVDGSWKNPRQFFDTLALERAIAADIIDGGIEIIKKDNKIRQLPLPLRDLLRAAQPDRAMEDIDQALDLAG